MNKILYIILAITFINALFLDAYLIFKDKINVNNQEIINSPIAIPTPVVVKDLSCPMSCLSAINDATASVNLSPPAPIVKTEQVINQVAATKEIFIPLGSGSTSYVDYADVTGMETYIDSSNYTNIKEIKFQATLTIPTANGKVGAKLYNVSDKHAVWFSEITADGKNNSILESGNLNLDSGKKLYRVQMYSSMGYPAAITNANIKIVLK